MCLKDHYNKHKKISKYIYNRKTRYEIGSIRAEILINTYHISSKKYN